MSNCSTYYTHEEAGPNGDETREFFIEGFASPYVPQTWDSPAEGGDVEDWTFTLEKIIYEDREVSAMQVPNRDEIAAEFEAYVEANPAVRERIAAALYEDYNRGFERSDD
jgi:hypothetical protein